MLQSGANTYPYITKCNYHIQVGIHIHTSGSNTYAHITKSRCDGLQNPEAIHRWDSQKVQPRHQNYLHAFYDTSCKCDHLLHTCCIFFFFFPASDSSISLRIRSVCSRPTPLLASRLGMYVGGIFGVVNDLRLPMTYISWPQVCTAVSFL